jgi:hypothetical protein
MSIFFEKSLKFSGILPIKRLAWFSSIDLSVGFISNCVDGVSLGGHQFGFVLIDFMVAYGVVPLGLLGVRI